MDIMEVSKRDMNVKAKALRRNGQVPGNVFGGHLEESVLIQVDQKVLSQMLAGKHIGSRLTLSMDGKKLPVQIKDKDVNSMNGEIRNISFQALAADQKVNSVAHIVLQNAEKNTNMLEFMMTEVPYDALPQNMVDLVEIDVDGMPVDTVVTVGDLKELNNNLIDLKVDKDEIVLRVSDPRRYEKDNEVPADDAAEETAAEA